MNKKRFKKMVSRGKGHTFLKKWKTKRKLVKKVHYILVIISKKGIKFHCEKCGNENGYTWKVWGKMCDNPIKI